MASNNASDLEKLAKIVHQSVARSAVFDMLKNGTDVQVDVA